MALEIVGLLVCVVLAFGVLFTTRPQQTQQQLSQPIAARNAAAASMSSASKSTVGVKPAGDPAARMASQAESADWLNDMLKVMWPYISQTVEEIAITTVQPMLQEMLPGPLSKITIEEMELGPQPIRVERVTVHSRDETGIALDLDVHYEATPKILLKMPLASVGVKHLKLVGRLGCLLRPLIDEIPLVGAVQASFVDLPELDFDLTGAANVADAPLIGRAIRSAVEKVIASMLVLPKRMIVPMNPKVSLDQMYYAPLGALKIEVLQGRGFVAKKTLGIKRRPDTYVVTKFADAVQQTSTAKNECDPTYSAEGSQVFLLCDKEQKIEFEIYDEDVGKDDLIATISTRASALMSGPATGSWLAPSKVLEETAEGAEILVKTTAFQLGREGEASECSGWQLATVLVERGNKLAGATSSWAKLTIGEEEITTGVVTSPEVPNPAMDAENPIWNLATDRLVSSFSAAQIELFDSKTLVGSLSLAEPKAHEPTALVDTDLPDASVTASLLLRPLVRMAAPGK